MATFEIEAMATFEAEDLDSAFLLLERHFRDMQIDEPRSYESSLTSGFIRVSPLKEGA